MSTIDANPYKDRPEPKKTAYVGALRKDGRHKVEYVFPLSGTRCTKLHSAEEITLMKATGNYVVVGI